jgi:hypothetical protein
MMGDIIDFIKSRQKKESGKSAKTKHKRVETAIKSKASLVDTSMQKKNLSQSANKTNNSSTPESLTKCKGIKCPKCGSDNITIVGGVDGGSATFCIDCGYIIGP